MVIVRLLCGLLSVSSIVVAKPETLKASKPNIILVITDDQGIGDLSCMGNRVVKTPKIDQFYESSLRFKDFQVSPTCAPTRAALMSGRPPFKVGVTHTILQRERMSLDVFTLPQALKKGGYQTGLFGKWHLGDDDAYLPQSRGFDEVLMHGAGGIGQVQYGDFPPNGENTYFDSVLLHNDQVVQTEGFCTDLFFDAAAAWVYQQSKTPQPYFAYISLNAPHAPMIAPESYKKRFLDLGYDDGTAGRYGMVENIDYNFGKLLARLKKWDALENTMIIFMTDNGATYLKGKLNGEDVSHFNAGMRGAKNSPHEGGTHVPFFVQWQGVLKQGVDVEALSAHIDLYPTFVELAGVELPAKMQELDGRSLLPLFVTPDIELEDRRLFIHRGRWKVNEREKHQYNSSAVRTSRWRLVNHSALYDIQNDPTQRENVASQHPEVVLGLQREYDLWWQSALPLMVNENLPAVEKWPLIERYDKQIKLGELPQWKPQLPDTDL